MKGVFPDSGSPSSGTRRPLVCRDKLFKLVPMQLLDPNHAYGIFKKWSLK